MNGKCRATHRCSYWLLFNKVCIIVFLNYKVVKMQSGTCLFYVEIVPEPLAFMNTRLRCRNYKSFTKKLLQNVMHGSNAILTI